MFAQSSLFSSVSISYLPGGVLGSGVLVGVATGEVLAGAAVGAGTGVLVGGGGGGLVGGGGGG